MKPISWSDFEKVDIRVGVVVDAGEFAEAKRPEVLVMGAYTERGEVVLLRPDEPIAPGSKIG